MSNTRLLRTHFYSCNCYLLAGFTTECVLLGRGMLDISPFPSAIAYEALFNYRPQQSCGKVIFSEAYVKDSVHRGVSASVHARIHTHPWAPPPPSRHLPLGRHPPPSRRLLLRTVRILLECILVHKKNFLFITMTVFSTFQPIKHVLTICSNCTKICAKNIYVSYCNSSTKICDC